MPQKDLYVTPKVSCFSFKYVIKATEMFHGKRKQISGAKSGSDPLQSASLRALFYPISIMSHISTKDSGMLYLTKNAKTNNDIAGYHLVIHRVITLRCPKRTFILSQKYHVLVSNML